MPHHFGNDHTDGYHAHSYQYEPKWERDIDTNPDHRPSTSGMFVEDRGKDVIEVLPVQGLGAIVLRAVYPQDQDSALMFMGVSIFSDQEIGFRK